MLPFVLNPRTSWETCDGPSATLYISDSRLRILDWRKLRPLTWGSEMVSLHTFKGAHWDKQVYKICNLQSAIPCLITIPDSKGKSVQYFSHGQARDSKLNNQARAFCYWPLILRALILPSVHLERHTFQAAIRELRAMNLYESVEAWLCYQATPTNLWDYSADPFVFCCSCSFVLSF